MSSQDKSLLYAKNRLLFFLRRRVKPLVRATGFDITFYPPKKEAGDTEFPPDFSADHVAIIKAVEAYTLTSPERVFSLIEAVRYIIRREIPGSIVECGVWRGGSMMAVALELQNLNIRNRDLHLFDTFEGMTPPKEIDVDVHGVSAAPEFAELQIGKDGSNWCRATLPDVKAGMANTGYDMERVHFHVGKVETTLPSAAPEQIALLRLDTDWYESTRHELEHLYPRLSRGGILIIDDYGHWHGQKVAVDEYIAKQGLSLFLSRIDHTGRIAVRMD